MGCVDSTFADTRCAPIAGNLLLANASDPPRDLRDRDANCSGNGGPAGLSERQGLSIDLGAPALSLSVGDIACGGTASDSVGTSDWRIEERRANAVGEEILDGCVEVRGRVVEIRCDCTRTGYGDSWSKTIELIDEPARTNRGDGDFEDKGVSCGTLGGYRSVDGTRLATDSRDAFSDVGVGERCTDGPGRFGTGC